MIGALWTGISGLAGQQTALDNESHNISNVNTVGYKASRISFADQMYQDKIGKGTKILDAEKLFVQGNLKLTGVAYDMAISGDGFFSVKNARASGTAETFYTRAGNFRMGDNGTLQDAAGNEVQGWAMSDIDPDSDVLSTNPNVTVFTSDYSKLVSSKVINHSNYVETITAKTTDYSNTAKADSETVFTGSGLKSKAAKVADIEELVANYSDWLGKLQDDPEGTSATSTAQKTQIKFEGTDFNKEGDQIYVYINGSKISQNFVSVTASTDADGDGVAPSTSTFEQEEDNLAASRIATYKALADKISEIPGLVAYTVQDSSTTGTYGTFEASDTFTKTTADPTNPSGSTSGVNALLGMIEIKSLIPGEEFTVTEVAEVSGNNTVQGQINTTASATSAVMGSGLGALESARDALSKAVSGQQRDVFSPTDLDLGNADEDYTFEYVIYDKDTKSNVTVGPISVTGIDTIDEIISALQQGGSTANPTLATNFNKYFNAENINGNLVISTNDTNYDVEFSTTLTANTKAFSSTKTFSGSDETVTFDQEFQPAPDASGAKTYTASVSFEEPFTVSTPTTAATITSSGGSAPTAYTNEFKLSVTFDDADNSMGRGAGTQTLEITIPANAGSADIDDVIADINSSSAFFGAGLDFLATNDGSDNIVITNQDGETISEVKFSEVITTSVTMTPQPTTLQELADDITASHANITGNLDTDGNLYVTLDSGSGARQELSVTISESGTDQIIEKNADYSGRAGAGAEFIELKNKVDQVASQGGMQLRLDTLGISDSAFGEFSVDNTGLITMKQDGAEFAIGQVSIALFNNTRGLEPYGDNLLAKTTSSGEPIYNTNNERTANIEGKTLELSTADLSESLVNLMVFQRAFEANAKSITTSDQLLNTLINLKR